MDKSKETFSNVRGENECIVSHISLWSGFFVPSASRFLGGKYNAYGVL